jgi:hypothetical protein
MYMILIKLSLKIENFKIFMNVIKFEQLILIIKKMSKV